MMAHGKNAERNGHAGRDLWGRLIALAERCEQASGPDRELDRDIGFAALGWKTYQHGEFSLIRGHDGESWADHPGSTYTFFTASIDAALTLIPDDCALDQLGTWEHHHLQALGPWYAIIRDPRAKFMMNPRSDHTATPALALCAAALRARASAASSPTAPEGE